MRALFPKNNFSRESALFPEHSRRSTATLHKTEIWRVQCALAFEGHGSGGAQAGVHTGAEGARDFVHASACMPPQTHPRAACMLASASARCMHANQRVRANVAPAVRRDAARTFSVGPAIRARSALSAAAHACMQTHPHSLCMRACSAPHAQVHTRACRDGGGCALLLADGRFRARARLV